MEKALKDTLTRAQRWGAVMLIDEVNVYISDDDIAANTRGVPALLDLPRDGVVLALVSDPWSVDEQEGKRD